MNEYCLSVTPMDRLPLFFRVVTSILFCDDGPNIYSNGIPAFSSMLMLQYFCSVDNLPFSVVNPNYIGVIYS